MESSTKTEIPGGNVTNKATSNNPDANRVGEVHDGLESETNQIVMPPGTTVEEEIQQVQTTTQTPALAPTVRGLLPAFRGNFYTDDSGMMVDDVGCGEMESHVFKVDRSCTDVFCCVIFALFLIGLIATALYAFSYGDPVMLVYPQDSNGNLCGLGPYANKKYLFMFDLLECKRLGPAVSLVGCPTTLDVCIEKCPDQDFVFLEHMKSQNKKNLICKEGVNVTNKSVGQLIWDGDCAAYYLKSMPMLGRCIPDPKNLDPARFFGKNMTLVNNYNMTVNSKVLRKIISVYKDFLKAREYKVKIVKCLEAHDDIIFISILIAMLISFVWIVLMQWIAACMVWMSLGMFTIVWPVLSFICWRRYILYKGTNETVITSDLIVDMSIRKEWFYLSAGVTSTVIFIIIMIALISLCVTIRLSIALIAYGSRGVSAMWSSLLWPEVPFIFEMAVVTLSCYIVLYLASIERYSKMNFKSSNNSLTNETLKVDIQNMFKEIACDNVTTGAENCDMSQYQNTNFLGVLSLYNLFMFYWLTCFVSALNQLTLAGIFSSYYWTFDKSRTLRHYYFLCTSFYNCFRYHLGSLALGSFLIAFLKFLSNLLEIAEHKLSNSRNPVASFTFKCLKCCLYYQTEFFKYINQNAYIMIAIEGKNFCTSAKNAVGLLFRNVLNALVLNRVNGLLFVFSKLIIVVIVGFITVNLIDARMPLIEDEDSSFLCYVVLLSISVIGTYIIANTFLGVYEIAVDTLFLCFLYDRENNDGSAERPYFMDDNLRNILKKRSFQRRFTSSSVDSKSNPK